MSTIEFMLTYSFLFCYNTYQSILLLAKFSKPNCSLKTSKYKIFLCIERYIIMIRSMTGYGAGESKDELGRRFFVEVKTINHRYCDIYIKMPKQISYLEEDIRNVAKKYISRGKTEVYVSYDDMSAESKKISVDNELAKGLVDACRNLIDLYELPDDVTASFVAKFPDVLKIEKGVDDQDTVLILLKEASEDALTAVVAMREREGEILKVDIMQRLKIMEEHIQAVEKKSLTVVEEYREKLAARIKELTEQHIVDENRLALEMVYIAERCGINEEIVRLKSHMNQVVQALGKGGPVGRRLDFLVQEMHREANTIGSKSNNLEITNRAVDIKTEIDKIREQVQNIE